jgi:hypothetical protein
MGGQMGGSTRSRWDARWGPDGGQTGCQTEARWGPDRGPDELDGVPNGSHVIGHVIFECHVTCLGWQGVLLLPTLLSQC